MKEKTKLALFTTEMQFGGVQLKLLRISKLIDKEKFEVHVISNGMGILHKKFKSIKEINLHTVPHLQRLPHPIKDFRAITGLIQILLRIKPDVVDYTGPKAALLGSIASRLTRVPMRIYTMAGITFNDRQSLLVRQCLILMEKLISLFSTNVINVSETNRDKIVKNGITNRQKTTTVYSGYNLNEFISAQQLDRQQLRKGLGWNKDDFVILQVNNLKKGKNNLDLLKTANIVLKQNPNCRFVIAGDGPDRSTLEEYIQKEGIAENCCLLGWREDIPVLMYAADVITLTTKYAEGLPQTCSQAMAVGRPLVMYDCEAIKEELTHGVNGWLIQIDDISDFAKKLILLANDPVKTKEMGERSFELLNHEHDVVFMVNRLQSIYSQKPGRILQKP